MTVLIGFAPRTIPTATRKAVFVRDGECCRYCGSTTGPFHLDHVMPWSRGGSNHASNLVVACAPCNIEKKDRTPEEMGWLALPILRPELSAAEENEPAKLPPNWLAHANPAELSRLSELDARIEELKAGQSVDRRLFEKIRNCCIKRMRRAAGKS